MLALEAGAGGRPDPRHARVRAGRSMCQATGPAIGLLLALGFRGGGQVAIAAQDPRRAGVGLALAVDLGGGGGDRSSAISRPCSRNGPSCCSASRRSCSPSAPCCGPRASAPRTASCSGCGRRTSRSCEMPNPAPGTTGDVRSRLMAEVAHSREQHREAGLVGGGDHFVVADRAAGLDDRGRAGFDRGEQPVGEREEGVRGDR